MQLEGNRVIVSCFNHHCFKMFQLEGRGSCVLSLAQEITELFRRRVPASASSKEHQNHKVPKLLNLYTVSISNMDILHVYAYTNQ